MRERTASLTHFGATGCGAEGGNRSRSFTAVGNLREDASQSESGWKGVGVCGGQAVFKGDAWIDVDVRAFELGGARFREGRSSWAQQWSLAGKGRSGIEGLAWSCRGLGRLHAAGIGNDCFEREAYGGGRPSSS